MEINKTCSCPKVKCSRHSDCVLCREHHKKRPPYCEKETKVTEKNKKQAK